MTKDLKDFTLIALLFVCATLLHTINDNRATIARLQTELAQCYQMQETLK